MAPAKTCAEADGGKHTETETEAADGTCASAASLIILSFGRATNRRTASGTTRARSRPHTLSLQELFTRRGDNGDADDAGGEGG